MKFQLTTSRYTYTKEQAKKLEILGFTFRETNYGLSKDSEGIIEISSLQELIDFSTEWGELVFSPDTIEIYDDYRE